MINIFRSLAKAFDKLSIDTLDRIKINNVVSGIYANREVTEEALNQLAEYLPGSRTMVANSLMVSPADLKEMVAEGDLRYELFIAALHGELSHKYGEG